MQAPRNSYPQAPDQDGNERKLEGLLFHCNWLEMNTPYQTLLQSMWLVNLRQRVLVYFNKC